MVRGLNFHFRHIVAVIALAFGPAAIADDTAGAEETIARVKPSVVAVGTYQRTRSPAFQFRGTGFVVGDGTLVATNAHVLPERVNVDSEEQIAILDPTQPEPGRLRVRRATVAARGAKYDLALLKLDGDALPAMRLGDSSQVREGRPVFFTGFPIGAVLGPYPVTHRGIVSSITPIAIPQGNATSLNAQVLRRLNEGSFPIFQLDATAYPGNSGSPVYQALDGTVIGIVNMVLVRATKESLLTQPSGITYAVPVAHLRELMTSLR